MTFLMRTRAIVLKSICIVTVVCTMSLQNLMATSIALGQKHSLVLSGNHIYGFGNDNFGQLGKIDSMSVVSGQISWVSVAAGGHHSLGLDRDLKVWSWGYNRYGQLGCGDREARHQPARVSQIEPIVKVVASLNNSFLLGVSGDVYGAGKANLLNRSSDEVSFSKIVLPSKSVMVSASASFAMSLDIGGNVWVWGENAFFQRAGGVQISKVDLPEKVKKICCGGFHALALGVSGNVYGWGKNDAEQLGDLPSIVQVPQVIDAQVMDIRAGREHSLLLKTNHIVGLGRNHVGQLGDQASLSNAFHHGDGQIGDFESGAYHCMSLNQEGQLTLWEIIHRGNCCQVGIKSSFPCKIHHSLSTP